MSGLAGQRVLVTGGARGIGFAIAERFAQEGCELVLTDVDLPAVRSAAAVLRDVGVVAHAYEMDVTDAADVDRVRAAVADEVGPIDVLVNNAGTVAGGPFLDVPLERHLQTYRVNTLGVVTVTHAFLPQMLARPSAHVVIIASAAGTVGVPYGTTYASSKWGALGFGESLRLELKELGFDNVSVTTVCPTQVSTGLFAGSSPPRLTPWLTPEQVAEAAVSGVVRRRGVVLTPWLVNLSPMLRGLLPQSVFDAVSKVFGVTTSMAGWTGHGAAGAPVVGSARVEAAGDEESPA
jgi:short-subunit dehydrogenase